MFQRIHSWFLLNIAAAGIVMMMLPVSTIKITPSGFEGSKVRIIEMDAFGKTETVDGEKSDAGRNKLLPISIILSVIVSLVTLFFAKSKTVKLKLCGLNYILICLTIVLIFFYCDLQTGSKNILMTSDYHAGAVMPFLQLLGNFFSVLRIKLDSRALNVIEQL